MTDLNITVRPAVATDSAGVEHGIVALLRELTGDSEHTLEHFDSTFARLLNEDTLGGVLVAEASGGEIVGVLTYSKDFALRTDGYYATIQELWVSHTVRSQGVGAKLTSALATLLAPEITRLEVGLPSPSFRHVKSTQSFYERVGFEMMGYRAKRLIP